MVVKERQVMIIVNHNPDSKINLLKKWGKLWKKKALNKEGEMELTGAGSHPKIAEIPVKIYRSITDSIKVFNEFDEKVFELQGEKTRQVDVLDDFLRGYLKQNKKWL